MIHRPHTPIAILLFMTVGPLQAQDGSLEQARGYMSLGACREAVDAAQRSIAMAPSAEAHTIVGTCLLRYDHADSAVHHFTRALDLDSTHADARIGRARAHMELGQAEAALADARRWTAARPGKWHGRLLEAQVHLFLYDSLDRAEALYSACLSEEPRHDVALYYMAITMHRKGDGAAAMEWVERGERDHPDDGDFPALRGRWAREAERWAEAATAYARAHQLSRSNRHAQYAAYCGIMANTDTGAWRRLEDGRVRFTHIGASLMERMDAMLGDPAGPYHYPRLVERFQKEPETLSLDAFFMAYYGQHTSKGYAPYADDIGRETRALVDQDRYEEAMRVAEKHLRTHPVCLDALQAMAVSARHVEAPERARAHMLRYDGLLQAILASGSGDSADDPIVVLSIRDEYIILDYQDLERGRQSLLRQGRYTLDRMECTDEEGQERIVYFEISKPFGTLGALLGGNKGTKKRGRKER
jgi:tetratricopeptide (TPR) repeat protein